MVVNLHENDRVYLPFHTGMVTERFPERVTGDYAGDFELFHRLVNDAPGLDSADRRVLFPPVGEDEFALPVLEPRGEGFNCLRVERYGLCFLRLPFPEGEMFLELVRVEVVDIAPFEPQQVTDTESGAASQHDHDVIAKLAFELEKACEGAKVIFAADRFCGCHENHPDDMI